MSPLSRRDVLTAFLGSAIASNACTRPKRVPDGELAFRPETLGHRVRDERPPAVPADKWEDADVVIVGGGVAGLATAIGLQEAGIARVVLLELESAVGGTARSGANATSAFPWGAHYITAPMKENADLVRLLDRFGVVEGTAPNGEPMFREEFACREPQERLFEGGAWHDGLFPHDTPTALDRADFTRFRAVIEAFAEKRDAKGRRAFAVPVAHGTDDSEITALDTLTMDAWLTREGFTSPRLRWLVDYACRDDFGTRIHGASAWAAIHYYASRLLAAGKEPQAVLTWPEGNGWLVARMAERVRPLVRSGLAAIDVVPRTDSGAGGVDVVALSASDCRGFHAKRVVVAAPQMVAARIVRPWRDAPPAHLARFAYGAWMVANITLSARPRARRKVERTMAWDNVLYDSPGLGYVVATHQTGRDYGPTVITYYHPLCDDDTKAARQRLYAASREEWADVALADLERAHPEIRELATRVDVVRWGHAIRRPSPGTFFRSDEAVLHRGDRGIHFAHTDMSGLALFEEAFYQGTRAAKSVATHLREGVPPT